MVPSFSKEIRWLLEEKYQGKKTPAFLRDLKRLKKGEHIDYLIEWKSFLNCKIDLRYRPLIPRVETEYWAEQAIADVEVKPLHRSTLSRLNLNQKVKCLD